MVINIFHKNTRITLGYNITFGIFIQIISCGKLNTLFCSKLVTYTCQNSVYSLCKHNKWHKESNKYKNSIFHYCLLITLPDLVSCIVFIPCEVSFLTRSNQHIDSIKDVELSFLTTNNLVSFTLPDYYSYTVPTNLLLTLDNSGNATGSNKVRHINFCPDKICINHVAIVIDESGSIDIDERNQIKRQLRKFVAQQKLFNDTNSYNNMYISFIGMSDSDVNTRKDNVLFERVSTNTITRFNNWIDGNGGTIKGFGQRYNDPTNYPGVSEGSDFWIIFS